MDVLRRYRQAFRNLVAWHRAASLKKRLLVSAAIIVCALAITVAVGLQKPVWRARIVQQLKAAGIDISPVAKVTEARVSKPVVRDPSIARSIAAGVSNRLVYFDSYHGSAPASLLALKEIGVNSFVFNGTLVAERDELFRAGVMVMIYAQHKPEMTEEECDIVRTYIANGGRVMLQCPAWVWVAYEKKSLDRLPYNRIAAEFGVFMSQDCVPGPLRVVHSYFGAGIFGADSTTAFSTLRYSKGYPILAGINRGVAALAATNGSSRAIVWGANNLLGGNILTAPEGRRIAEQAFNWLLDDTVNLKVEQALSLASDGKSKKDGDSVLGAPIPLDDVVVARSIASGISARDVYIDGYHAVAPSNLSPFQQAELHPAVYPDGGFIKNRDQLFKSGLLVMMYGMNKPEPTSAEYGVIAQYVRNGGRLLLMCPAWVWDAYEHKPLSELPYDKIARQFGLAMETTYAKLPLKGAHPAWTFGGCFEKTNDVFSTIACSPGTAVPILAGADGRPVAVAATQGKGRIILWGHDNLLAEKTVTNPMVRDDVARMLRWLLEK